MHEKIYSLKKKSGKKSEEGRLCYTNFKKLSHGSRIRFCYRKDKYDDSVCEVLSTHVHASFY